MNSTDLPIMASCVSGLSIPIAKRAIASATSGVAAIGRMTAKAIAVMASAITAISIELRTGPSASVPSSVFGRSACAGSELPALRQTKRSPGSGLRNGFCMTRLSAQDIYHQGLRLLTFPRQLAAKRRMARRHNAAISARSPKKSETIDVLTPSGSVICAKPAYTLLSWGSVAAQRCNIFEYPNSASVRPTSAQWSRKDLGFHVWEIQRHADPATFPYRLRCHADCVAETRPCSRRSCGAAAYGYLR